SLSSCAIQVDLELGHPARLRDKGTSAGFAHDWTVFVRGMQVDNIWRLVQQVCFLIRWPSFLGCGSKCYQSRDDKLLVKVSFIGNNCR
uniref:Uncharacterized protein n=1 Tax=Mola mola TaxID=94237 RepID=A0A3Q4AVT1_MOLML